MHVGALGSRWQLPAASLPCFQRSRSEVWSGEAAPTCRDCSVRLIESPRLAPAGSGSAAPPWLTTSAPTAGIQPGKWWAPGGPGTMRRWGCAEGLLPAGRGSVLFPRFPPLKRGDGAPEGSSRDGPRHAEGDEAATAAPCRSVRSSDLPGGCRRCPAWEGFQISSCGTGKRRA